MSAFDWFTVVICAAVISLAYGYIINAAIDHFIDERKKKNETKRNL